MNSPSANIVQAECRDKFENMVFTFAMPRRSLYYPNIVQAERRDKFENTVFIFAMPRRSLYYPNIVQAERRDKFENTVFTFAMPSEAYIYFIRIRIWIPSCHQICSCSFLFRQELHLSTFLEQAKQTCQLLQVHPFPLRRSPHSYHLWLLSQKNIYF